MDHSEAFEAGDFGGEGAEGVVEPALCGGGRFAALEEVLEVQSGEGGFADPFAGVVARGEDAADDALRR